MTWALRVRGAQARAQGEPNCDSGPAYSANPAETAGAALALRLVPHWAKVAQIDESLSMGCLGRSTLLGRVALCSEGHPDRADR